MKITRRQFLKYAAITGAAATLPLKMAVREAWAQYGFNSPNLTKFVDPIRMVGTIPLASPDNGGVPMPFTSPYGSWSAIHYTINIGQFNDVLHSDFITPAATRASITGWKVPPAYGFINTGFAGTKLWGFNPATNLTPRHLGGIIVAGKGAPVQITFRNNLPPTHIIPVDVSASFPDAANGQNDTSVHLHGGFVPWISDGGPFATWRPTGPHGVNFLNNQVLRPAAAANEAEYYYPNDQSARLVWYHDHAHDLTRINAYAGIASGYVIHDPAAEAVLMGQGIPSDIDLYDPVALPNGGMIYLIFQDKIFFGPAGPPINYIANAGPGDLGYPYIYDTALFGPLGIPSFPPFTALAPLPIPSVVPEMFGDTILVNGTAYPFLTVEARRYRIRMLNACNSRFLNPRLVATAGTGFPNNTEPAPTVAGPSFIQIGTEGGYLPAAVPVNGKKQLQLLIAPAERADLIVDFTGVMPGKEFILYNDAPGPFPGGSKIFDYYPNNSKTPTSTPGFGPNTRTLLKFKVAAGAGSAPLPATITLPVGQAYGNAPLVNQAPGVPTPIPAQVTVGGQTYAVNVRDLTLNEGFDEYGRLAQYLGTHVATNPGFFGRRYMDPATEVIPAGSVEVWQIANLTADAHPIHFHLVNVQILSRQPFNVRTYNGIPNFTGMPVAPDANELGWKETVRMNPGQVTTVIMKFDLPVVPFTVPSSPRAAELGITPSPGQTLNEYVWHCHILEHEEHDMMRPLVVTS